MNKLSTLGVTLSVLLASGLANAAGSYSAEIGPNQADTPSTTSRAAVQAELNTARQVGVLKISDPEYPGAVRATATKVDRAEVVRETLQGRRDRAEAARIGANGYLPG